ncbi:hypothetical protein DESPIG_01549 [Desulfovibrio piger ATCC 29098]|uniref:Uncharacterized protein n=1 Tax=Desulfovibrio piger ATCC 29098 TaxID=411464 RepID=B6WTZ2_9BACT|nr:hypothetical protein DESPIG_01549 [Desulfovibrio piger ATCC 29098]
MTWKAHRDAVLYGDVREGGQAMTVFFGRIGTALGQDKRKCAVPGWTSGEGTDGG